MKFFSWRTPFGRRVANRLDPFDLEGFHPGIKHWNQGDYHQLRGEFTFKCSRPPAFPRTRPTRVDGVERWVAAISATPADRGLRLVFADWLEDRGEIAWANYIRIAEAAWDNYRRNPENNPSWMTDYHYYPIIEAGKRLIELWDPPLSAFLSDIGAYFNERVVGRWTMDWSEIVDEMLGYQLSLPSLPQIEWSETYLGFFAYLRAESVYAIKSQLHHAVAASPIQLVEVCGTENAADLADIPALRNVRELRVGWLDREGAQRFARSPNLSALETLHISAGAITDSGLDAMLRSQHLPALRWVSGPMISQAAILRAADSRSYGRAVHVYSEAVPEGLNLASRLGVVVGTRLGDSGIARLAMCPEVGQTHLDLRNQDIGDEGAIALAQSPHLAEVEKLDFENNRIGPAGAAAIANSPRLRKLRQLDLSGCPIGDRGAIAVAESELFPNIDRLVLRRCDIGDEGALAFARQPVPRSMRALALQENRIGEPVGEALRALYGRLVAYR